MPSLCSHKCFYCASFGKLCLAGNGDDEFIPASEEEMKRRRKTHAKEIAASEILEKIQMVQRPQTCISCLHFSPSLSMSSKGFCNIDVCSAVDPTVGLTCSFFESLSSE